MRELGERFAAAGHELALVGGPVRDALLGRPSTDLDFTTDARPEQTEPMLRRLGHARLGHRPRRSARSAPGAAPIVEITTYRSDAYDRQTRASPRWRTATRWRATWRRRDFTVNAMALRLPGLSFVDPYGGLADLAARVLRTPGTPEESFADDPLRMMRAARFAAQLGFVRRARGRARR